MCPRRDSDCDDHDPCTRDRLSGSAENCSAVCTHAPIVERSAGDGCCAAEATVAQDADCAARCESCANDDGGCPADCQPAIPPELRACLADHANSACQRCSCEKCGDVYLACRAGQSSLANRLCSAVIDCAERAQCTGEACFCGEGSVCAIPQGPCEREIAAAGGTRDPVLIRAHARDPESALGHASAVGMCRVTNWRDVCMGGAM